MVYEYMKAFPRAYILPPDLRIPDRLPEDATAVIETRYTRTDRDSGGIGASGMAGAGG
jgi:hypothetical protein